MRAILPLQLDDHWLALPASAILEIRGAQPWVPIPAAPQATPGVLAWSGRAIAVLDLGAVLRVAAPLQPGQTRPRVLIARLQRATCAVLAHAVQEVAETPELRPLHATRLRLCVGEVLLHDRYLPVLDLPAVEKEILPHA